MKLVAYREGCLAALANFQRVVPEMWQLYSLDWLRGYDDITKKGNPNEAL